MKPKTITTICLFAMAVLLAGCDAESNSNQNKSSQESSHSHPHLSLHKPKTLSAAIQRMCQMHESLVGTGDFPSPIEIPYVEVIHGEGASGHSHFYSKANYEAGSAGHSEEDEKVKHHTMKIDLRTEMADVAKWLPDIAASSNLEEADWNSVKSLSGGLTKIIEEISPDASDASFRESWKQKSEEVKGMLDKLQTFNESTGSAK